MSDSFYSTKEWKNIRYEVLRNSEGKCKACGRSPNKHKVVLHVDHIIPRFMRPDLALYKENLQVLCDDCNLGKAYNHFDYWHENGVTQRDPSKVVTKKQKHHIKKASCDHEPFWNNDISPTVFKNGTPHFKMKCIKCNGSSHVKKELALKLIEMKDGEKPYKK